MWKLKSYQDDLGVGQSSSGDSTSPGDIDAGGSGDDAPQNRSSFAQFFAGPAVDLRIGSGLSGLGSGSASNSPASDPSRVGLDPSPGVASCDATVDDSQIPSSGSNSDNFVQAQNPTGSGVGQSVNAVLLFGDGGAHFVARGSAPGSVAQGAEAGGSASGLGSEVARGDSQAGTGGSATGSTSTMAGGSASVQSGGQQSGLIINVTYDSSCNSAPAAFKTDVAAVVSYFERAGLGNLHRAISGVSA